MKRLLLLLVLSALTATTAMGQTAVSFHIPRTALPTVEDYEADYGLASVPYALIDVPAGGFVLTHVYNGRAPRDVLLYEDDVLKATYTAYQALTNLAFGSGIPFRGGSTVYVVEKYPPNDNAPAIIQGTFTGYIPKPTTRWNEPTTVLSTSAVPVTLLGLLCVGLWKGARYHETKPTDRP
jgi:hypothetical protein